MGKTAKSILVSLGVRLEKYNLPQIAAMADNHFGITKSEKDGRTVTEVKKLLQYESVEELTRLLGGAAETAAAKANAKEMIAMAKKVKKQVGS